MFRLLTPIVNLIIAITIGGIFQGGVSLNIDTPTEVVAGTEFEVTVYVQKGDLDDFSRLQQILPAGLTAEASLTSNADFTFKEKQARFIWLRLPRQENFSVIYKVKVDERLKGTFSIDGKFSYIDQNERKSVNISSNPIFILPSANIDPALIVDVNDFEDQVIPYIAPIDLETGMACVRQTPQEAASGNAYVVNLLVSKEEKQKFAKIEEQIPKGYRAENIDQKDADFTFKDGVAKFLWFNLPSDPYFIVSYKLIPTSTGSKTPQPVGKFSYLEGEKTISLDIKQTNSDLANLAPGDIGTIFATAGKGLAVTSVTGRETENTTQLADQNTAAGNQQNSGTQIKTPPSTGSQTSTSSQSLMLEPEYGIYYRVQLAAGHKNINIPRYFKKYQLDKEVRIEQHDGWNKYSVGSFPQYKEARDYRVHIWNTTVIDDAFVSAYNNGARITVQEALMVANQQWYP